MIRFLGDLIDQLDTALDQLAINDPNFDRFAIMLIDNVVELALHKYAQDKASENELWARIKESKHDPKDIQKALGQRFENKVKFAAKTGLIDSVTCETILNLHSFRNTAYHRGIKHEGILHSLALFYFRIACHLLSSYDPKWWSWSSEDRLSHRAIKYIGKQPINAPGKLFPAAFRRLEEVASSMGENLIESLSSDMYATICDIDDALQFLVDGAPQERTRDEVIVDCLDEEYPWQIRRDPISGWQTRLESLRYESDPNQALKKYCDFMKQTEDIRSKILEAAAQLDMYIQQQIDEARGK